MWLHITAYAISRTFDMTSRPRQPQLAMCCWLLLLSPVIDKPRCFQGCIWAQKARTLDIPVFPVQKGHGCAITVTYIWKSSQQTNYIFISSLSKKPCKNNQNPSSIRSFYHSQGRIRFSPGRGTPSYYAAKFF